MALLSYQIRSTGVRGGLHQSIKPRAEGKGGSQRRIAAKVRKTRHVGDIRKGKRLKQFPPCVYRNAADLLFRIRYRIWYAIHQCDHPYASIETQYTFIEKINYLDIYVYIVII